MEPLNSAAQGSGAHQPPQTHLVELPADILRLISGFADYTRLFRLGMTSHVMSKVAWESVKYLRLDQYNLGETSWYPWSSFNVDGACMYSAFRYMTDLAPRLTNLTHFHIAFPKRNRFPTFEAVILEPLCKFIKAKSKTLTYLSFDAEVMARTDLAKLAPLWIVLTECNFPQLRTLKLHYIWNTQQEILDIISRMPRLRRLKLSSAYEGHDDRDRANQFIASLAERVPNLEDLFIHWSHSLSSMTPTFAQAFRHLKKLSFTVTRTNRVAPWRFWVDELDSLPSAIGPHFSVNGVSLWHFMATRLRKEIDPLELLRQYEKIGFDPLRHTQCMPELAGLLEYDKFQVYFEKLLTAAESTQAPRPIHASHADAEQQIYWKFIGKNGYRFYNVLERANTSFAPKIFSADPTVNPLLRLPMREHAFRILLLGIFLGDPASSERLIDLLVNQIGFDVNTCDGIGNNALHIAGLCAYEDTFYILPYLLAAGADITHANAGELRPVEYWCEVCNLKELALLLPALLRFYMSIGPNGGQQEVPEKAVVKTLAEVPVSPTHAIMCICALLTPESEFRSLPSSVFRRYADHESFEDVELDIQYFHRKYGSKSRRLTFQWSFIHLTNWLVGRLMDTSAEAVVWIKCMRLVLRMFARNERNREMRALRSTAAIWIADYLLQDTKMEDRLPKFVAACLHLIPITVDERDPTNPPWPNAACRFLQTLLLKFNNVLGSFESKPVQKQVLSTAIGSLVFLRQKMILAADERESKLVLDPDWLKMLEFQEAGGGEEGELDHMHMGDNAPDEEVEEAEEDENDDEEEEIEENEEDDEEEEEEEEEEEYDDEEEEGEQQQEEHLEAAEQDDALALEADEDAA